MRTRLGEAWRALAAAIAMVCLLSNAVHAQSESPPYDPAIDVQLFDLNVGPGAFMSVADAEVENASQFSIDFLITFLTDPFVILNVDENEEIIDGARTDVVSSMLAGQLVGAYGLTDKLQLGVSLPLVFSLSGQGLNPRTGDMATEGLQATGFGDLRLIAKGTILDDPSYGLAWIGSVTVPTSFGAGGNAFLGDDLPSLRGGVAAHYDIGEKLRVGGNVGAILRKPRQIYASEVGQQLTYGAGLAFRATDSFSIIGETFGRRSLLSADLDASPLEVGGGVRAQATRSFSVLAGGGVGVLSGIGSPGLRFMVSVGYAPDLGDTDKDGINNMDDQCPLVPEDRDDWQDSDGCPEEDNDGDLREDSVDKCPNDKEDLDGFEDEDGCPEDDNDGDKILDLNDKCPLDPEDGRPPFAEDGCPANKRDSDDDGVSDLDDACPEAFEDADGFEDWDGCPEEDNDRDGIADADDQCPLCPEDLDGNSDEDGCPDLDNDHDGVSDQADQCPDEPETINGNNDDDGCPDSGRALATLDGNRLQLDIDIRFSSRNTIRKERDVVALARVLRSHSDVTLWRVVVAAKRRGSDDETRANSQAQADALKTALIKGGVAEERIEAIGAVSDNPIVAIAVVDRSEEGDLTCPASMEVQERQPPAAAP